MGRSAGSFVRTLMVGCPFGPALTSVNTTICTVNAQLLKGQLAKNEG